MIFQIKPCESLLCKEQLKAKDKEIKKLVLINADLVGELLTKDDEITKLKKQLKIAKDILSLAIFDGIMIFKGKVISEYCPDKSINIIIDTLKNWLNRAEGKNVELSIKILDK